MALGSDSVLVTGANRGIGLEFVRQLVQSPTPPRHVFATYRNKSTVQALEQIKDTSNECRLILIQADVTKKEDVESLRKKVEDVLGDSGLNLLINNAAAAKWLGFPELTQDNMLFHFSTNTVGPVIMVQELLPLLQRAAETKANGSMGVARAAVINISSYVGSIGDAPSPPRETLQAISYRTSKAALNMVMRMISIPLNEKGILVVNMCPGWVRTEMGTDDAPIDVTESVSSMLNTLPKLGESHHGNFFDRHGEPIPF